MIPVLGVIAGVWLVSTVVMTAMMLKVARMPDLPEPGSPLWTECEPCRR